jgi:hypothetical protein
MLVALILSGQIFEQSLTVGPHSIFYRRAVTLVRASLANHCESSNSVCPLLLIHLYNSVNAINFIMLAMLFKNDQMC